MVCKVWSPVQWKAPTGETHMKSSWCFQNIRLMEEIRLSPVDMVRYPIVFDGFYTSKRWLFGISEPSTVCFLFSTLLFGEMIHDPIYDPYFSDSGWLLQKNPPRTNESFVEFCASWIFLRIWEQIQLMVNWWFGALWFGFLGSLYARESYLWVPRFESQSTGPQTTKTNH